jgi:hypothetical protein
MPGTLNPWKRLPGNRPLEDEVASRGAWLVQLRWWAVAALFAGTGLARWILGTRARTAWAASSRRSS